MGAAPRYQQRTLANGLRVNLIHDPDATRAATLIQLAAGSDNEPSQWPGLAHLLEHVLFAGGEGFQGEARLMTWGPAEGARLNATTQANDTAWFFEIDAPKLADGLIRLVDMLARPLLSLEAIRQETTVIEAEYQMLTGHSDTLCEAALSQAFVSPHRFQHFHIGNQAAFGKDTAALQQALRAYHRRFFSGDNLILWLLGPQSPEELDKLGAQHGSLFSAGGGAPFTSEETLTLRPARAFGLHSAGEERLRFSFPIANPSSETFTLLCELLTDGARYSLLATLRARGLCDEIRLLEPWRSPQQSLLSVELQLSHADIAHCAAIEQIFSHWLSLLPDLTRAQLGHYAALSRRRFTRLSSLDQLRALAMGFPPVDSERVADWAALLAQLRPDNMTRLWLSPAVIASETTGQGIALKLCAIDWQAEPAATPPAMMFYPMTAPLASPSLPAERAALVRFPTAGEARLLLSPSPRTLSPRQAAIVQASLRSLTGECEHYGGELSFTHHQGVWLLQLAGEPALMLHMLDAVMDKLTAPSAADRTQGERIYLRTRHALRADIAVRCLLARLTELLENAAPDGGHGWRATLYGAQPALHQALARLLSRYPGEIIVPSGHGFPALPVRPHYTCPTDSKEAATIVFCPLAEQTAECMVAWQLMATLFEPRFFQQLRVEKNIGYVVSCRLHQTAGTAGILFALQSPGISHETLFDHINDFIAEMAGVIAALSAETINEKVAFLSRTHPAPTQKLEHWQYLQLNLSPATPDIFTRFPPSTVQKYYRRLVDEPQRWWRLSNLAASTDEHLP